MKSRGIIADIVGMALVVAFIVVSILAVANYG